MSVSTGVSTGVASASEPTSTKLPSTPPPLSSLWLSSPPRSLVSLVRWDPSLESPASTACAPPQMHSCK
eukprot:4313723-Alexandrium_andersonii.AAC.1